MQTFVPYPDFGASAAVLDGRRLGKQRVETFQILRALTWPTYGWKNHPAVRMWRGFTPALVCYGLATCDEWEARGHADATRSSLLEFTGGRVPVWEELIASGQLPPWLGHDPVHVSHQSALLRKEPAYYREFFPDVPEDLPYVWPSAAFPRWPVRRGGVDPLALDEALALLGFTEAWEPQREAVEAACAGRDLTLRLPPGGGATTAGLLAGLCTAGSTLWVVPGPALPAAATRPATRPLEAASRGKVSGSIARAASPDAAAATALEAAAAPEFHFLRAHQVGPTPRDGVGLLVVEDADARIPPLGLPVLTLATLAGPAPDAAVVLDRTVSARADAPPR